jgi:hypothetical protein
VEGFHLLEKNMKHIFRGGLICLALVTTTAVSHAQQQQPVQQQQQPNDLRHRPNETLGYGADKVLKFTYTENFDCVDQPRNDLDFNGVPADRDPTEMQVPICQAGINPTINPPGMVGHATGTTDPIYVLVPMFSVNNDQNPNDAISCTGVVTGTLCGSQLGSTLIKFFGALPEAFKATPLVYTQCPDPGLPAGTCTMHASRIDLAPVLAALGYIGSPPTANVFVPSPNHSHVLEDSQIKQKAEWWQVIPVLVMDQTDWPNKIGGKGITSVAKLEAAVNQKRAIEAPSNFFLYFASQPSMKM